MERSNTEQKDMRLNLQKFWTSNKISQSASASLKFNFNLEELFAEDAKPVSEYFLQGFSSKIELNLWDGFHKFILEVFKGLESDDYEKRNLFKSIVLPMMPLYMTQLNGKLETKINKKGLEAMVDHPLAKEHLNNMHTLMGKNLPPYFLNEMEYAKGFKPFKKMMDEEHLAEIGHEGKFTPEKVSDFVDLWYEYAKKFDSETEEQNYNPLSVGTGHYAKTKMLETGIYLFMQHLDDQAEVEVAGTLGSKENGYHIKGSIEGKGIANLALSMFKTKNPNNEYDDY